MLIDSFTQPLKIIRNNRKTKTLITEQVNIRMDKLQAETTKPKDASDINSKEEAIEEVKRLRKLIKDVTVADIGNNNSTTTTTTISKVNPNPTKELSKKDLEKGISICEGKSSGDLSMLIDGDTNLNVVNEDDETMLHLACTNGNAKCVEVLINCGANLDLKDDFGKSPMRLACGAPKNKISDDHFKCIELLLLGGGDQNVVCDYGWTPLHKACEMGYIKAVELLVNHPSVDINKKEKGGETALDKATEKEHVDVIELLKSKGGEEGGD